MKTKHVCSAIGGLIFLVGISVPVRIAISGIEVSGGVGIAAGVLVLVGAMVIAAGNGN